jgi:FKBP-type peptidyl-prolyl cis-trans isomerase FklB
MRWYLFMAIVLSLLLSSGILCAEEAPKLESETDRISYSLGYQIGGDFKRQGVGLDAEALVRGFNDASVGAEAAMGREEMNATLSNLKGKISTAQRESARERFERKKKEAEEKRSKGRSFMAQNAQKPGVKTLPSGLQYKVIREGTGKSPVPHDTVTVNYRGTLISGQEFDSSYGKNEPATFRVNGVIKGWTESLQRMREGAKWELYIPPDLAYSSRGPLADQTVIYEIELLGIGEDSQAAESKPSSSEQQ